MLASASIHSSTSSSISVSLRPARRYAVLGAGFAGLSVAWHLLKNNDKDVNLRIDIFDEVGIGGGASGVSGGLLHPYSPKAKLLWRGAECWNECLKLLSIAEKAALPIDSISEFGDSCHGFNNFIVRRRGILRPATSMKNLNVLYDNAQNCDASCRIETVDADSAQNLVPNICLPFKSAFYMPQAVNVHPLRYLRALFLACEKLVRDLSASCHGKKEIFLHKQSIQRLVELEGDYDAVIISLGAKANMLPELAGRLPLRTCRGKSIPIVRLQFCRMHGLPCKGVAVYIWARLGNGNQETRLRLSQQTKLRKPCKSFCRRHLHFTPEYRIGVLLEQKQV
ncbi:uncharacterized protein LOC126665552 isoform X2 [Mercurialis annua]|uniref:uncharacterized protein LOC126665552 isoform X2 n=1 Tax=Mercurialis annua TaxID=3986 RepID=UPI0024AEBF02|nr:uncharacterized protein LOC126665552 isoform X2 [Mercurialis annua]